MNFLKKVFGINQPRDIEDIIQGEGNYCASLLKENPSSLQNIKEYLTGIGVDENLTKIGSGTDALVIADKDEKYIIRIQKSSNNKPDRTPPQVLSATSAIEIDGFIVETAPFVKSKGKITQEHVDELIIGLAKEGCIPRPGELEDKRGIRHDNIRLLPDGTPVIIDPGCHLPASIIEKEGNDFDKQYFAELLQKENKFSWRTPEGVPKQVEAFPQLKNGKFSSRIDVSQNDNEQRLALALSQCQEQNLTDIKSVEQDTRINPTPSHNKNVEKDRSSREL